MKIIKSFLIEITPAVIKFLTTIFTILIFTWISTECYLKETLFPIILLWLFVVIFLNIIWKYNIRWPRGRYNGQRIDGFELKFHLHLFWWRFKPIIHLKHGMYYVIWLCFSIRGEASYK